MRNMIILIILFSLYGCNESKKTVQFKSIAESELNFPADTTFAIPHGKIWDERKRIHDSCMGSSYAVNAVFMRTRDSFPPGCVVDMKTMKMIKRFPLANDTLKDLFSVFKFETKPCYDRRPINIPIDSFMDNRFVFKIDTSNDKINNELIEAVRNSPYSEIETGLWLNMEVTDALGKILDTTTDENLLDYKRALLTPGNMILVRSSAITEVSFYFHAQKPLPDNLIKKLLSKPVSIEQPYFKSQLFYVNKNTFELTLNGFFQIIGQFMKCELE